MRKESEDPMAIGGVKKQKQQNCKLETKIAVLHIVAWKNQKTFMMVICNKKF